MAAVKLGAGRQVVIPRKLCDQLGLTAGDYLEVELRGKKLIFTPRALIERRLSESFEDFKKGRTLGPFDTAKEAMRALRAKAR